MSGMWMVWFTDDLKKTDQCFDFVRTDIATLRSQHHICGILTGTLPHLSQQNVFLGVPLILLPEEVVLLVENGGFGNSTIRDILMIDCDSP